MLWTKAIENRWSESTHELVHHSDQGVPVCIPRLCRLSQRAFNILISMSRKGNPYDNAFAESFMKTLKVEEVYRMNTEHLKMPIEILAFLLRRCTTRRGCISALGYRSPNSFEVEFA